MKMKFVMMLICFFGTMAVIDQAQAACDPCKCGPGGDYKGDIGEWFRQNCSGRGNGGGNGGGGGRIGPRPGRPVSSCDHICPTGYICEDSVNNLGPVYQCLRPEPGTGRPIGN